MIKQRRYDLDWLRVISVFAVFLHHVFMPFNGDDFHIMNKEHSKLLDDTMVYFEQFRLPLLFLISGVGTVFAFSKRNWLTFLKERTLRLLIPLIFGVVFLIPPQTFYENPTQYKSLLIAFPELITDLKVNHLWFIENLFLMSVFSIPIITFFRSTKSEKIKKSIYKVSSKFGMFSWVILLILIKVITKEYFPSNSKSFFNPSTTLYYGFFFIGGILIATTKNLWKLLLNNRKRNLVILIVMSLIFYIYYFFPNKDLKLIISLENRWRIWYVVCSFLSWSAIITILGYSQVILDKKSTVLSVFNQAVYPFYMLHQTIIIIIGYHILQLNVSIFFKASILLISSFFTITLIYRTVIYPFKLMRFLFGMKAKNR